MCQHPTQLVAHRRRGHRRHGLRARRRFPGLAHRHGNARGGQGLSKNLSDVTGGIRVEVERARRGTPGVDRHRANVPLVAADLLRVPRRQVRGPLEESPTPVQSNRCNSTAGKGARRLRRKSSQASATRHISLIGRARAEKQIALRVEVQGAAIAAQLRARLERVRGIQMRQRRESSQRLRGRCRRMANRRVLIKQNLARLSIHDNTPRGVLTSGRPTRNRAPQLLHLRLSHRIASRLGGHRSSRSLHRSGGRSCRRRGTRRCATSAQKGDSRHKCSGSAYNWPHRRAMHGYPFVVT